MLTLGLRRGACFRPDGGTERLRPLPRNPAPGLAGSAGVFVKAGSQTNYTDQPPLTRPGALPLRSPAYAPHPSTLRRAGSAPPVAASSAHARHAAIPRACRRLAFCNPVADRRRQDRARHRGNQERTREKQAGLGYRPAALAGPSVVGSPRQSRNSSRWRPSGRPSGIRP
jgi:hypothetical protein